MALGQGVTSRLKVQSFINLQNGPDGTSCLSNLLAIQQRAVSMCRLRSLPLLLPGVDVLQLSTLAPELSHAFVCMVYFFHLDRLEGATAARISFFFGCFVVEFVFFFPFGYLFFLLDNSFLDGLDVLLRLSGLFHQVLTNDFDLFIFTKCLPAAMGLRTHEPRGRRSSDGPQSSHIV